MEQIDKVKPTGPSKKPFIEPTSSTSFPKLSYHKQRYLDIKLASLPLQKIRRINANQWNVFSGEIKGIERAFETIKFDKNIQALSLTLSLSSKLANKKLLHLAHSLKNLKFLKRVTIKFWGSNLTDAGLSYLAKLLSTLPSLQSFSALGMVSQKNF